MNLSRSFVLPVLLGAAMIPGALAQAASPQNGSSGQGVPDAPSATRPLPKPSADPQLPTTAPPDAPAQTQDTQPQSTPSSQITTVPPGSVPPPQPGTEETLYKLSTNVNFVLVPVTVKDQSGHLVPGLLAKDFTVLEGGAPQRVTFFTSDPFALSAAVVLDLSMPDVEFKKVRNTIPAMMGAFGEYDELSIYTYSTSVQQVQEFVAATSQKLTQITKKLQQDLSARQAPVPVLNGPLASGPSVNGQSIDPGAQATVGVAGTPSPVYTPESHVLNDAILAAAIDLSHRDVRRRKILFVVSEGREIGSDASYSDVLRYLQQHNISVYAVAVGQGGLPGYRTLQKLRIPGQGYGEILPKYASATGGQVFSEFSKDAIESAYSRVTLEARNQYTIGYNTQATPSSSYREIEVRVKRPNVNVIARRGYIPLPPARREPPAPSGP